MRSWLVRRWYGGVYWGAWATLTLGWSMRVTGRRNMPMSGPALLISNHQSFIDPLLIGSASPRYYLTQLARDTLFRNPVLAALIRSLGGVPINRDVGKAGLQTTLDVLGRGDPVVVFPEGERTHDGTLQPFQPGVSLLVKRARAPIVPIGIAGTYDAWSRHRKLPRAAPLFLPAGKGTIAVAIGKPIDPESVASLPREKMLGRLYEEVAKCVAEAERIRRKPKRA